MARTYKLISADSHINEPPDLWTSRVPAEFRDRAPRIEHFDQGDAWVMEGALDPINFGANCNVGLPPEQRPAWIKFEDVRTGGWDPAARLGEQDQDKVDAEILYPTPRVSNQVLWYTEDRDFHLACIRAYNDWLAEYCAYAPDRLWGVALMPNVGVEEAVAELRRTMAMPGIKGALLGQYPHGGEAISDEDDAFWAVAEELNAPLSVHVGFATTAQGDKSRGKSTGSLRFFDAPIRATQFVEGGVFDRFPNLHLVLVEVDCSWLPYMREQMDDRFKRTVPTSRPDIKRMPSEYFTDNIFSTFITDTYGIKNREAIGVSQMMWSSDYPHSGADWPNSWKTIEDHFAGVSEGDRQEILAGNAVRLYASEG
jgi:predicted TIM-barrel fold metal-dependent hydrolase